MRPGLFGQLIPKLRLSDGKAVTGHDNWQLWEATEDRAFGNPEKLYLLYFDSRANWTVARHALDESRKHAALKRLFCVVQSSSDLARDLPRLKKEASAVDAFTVRQLLAQSVSARLGRLSGESSDRLFVDPDLRPDGTAKAIQTLSAWLKDDSGDGPRIGVLVAKAGVGKTTVARELFRTLYGKDGAGRFPILVESDQWAKLSDRAGLTLWDVWRESLDVHYTSALGREEFDLCVEYGLFLPIFDGFDELCTRLAGHFSASETIAQLDELLRDTEGRVILTTRDTFWSDNVPSARRQGITQFDLFAFNKQQTAKFLENRFSAKEDFPKREIANKILQRISHVAHHGEMPDFRERLVAVPVVIALTAECADMDDSEAAVQKYGALLSSEDPLRGLILILFERERERQKLLLDAETQLRLFSALAFNHGDVFTSEQLKLYASMHGLQGSQTQVQALQSHVALSRNDGHFSFRFEFLGGYLAASELIDRLIKDGPSPRVVARLEQEANGGSLLIERAVAYLFAHYYSERFELLKSAWKTVGSLGAPAAQSGLLHIVLKAVEREVGSGPRQERTKLLLDFIETKNQTLSNLTVHGRLKGLDLRGITFDRCTLLNSGFSTCVFDSNSRFAGCAFEGFFDLDECESFEEVSYEACNLGSRARDVIQAGDQRGAVPVTAEQVRSTVRTALQKFQRGLSFKVVPRSDQNKGRIAISPIKEQVWRALERHQIIFAADIAGIKKGGLEIGNSRHDEVRLFLSNAIATGLLKRCIELLVEELVPRVK